MNYYKYLIGITFSKSSDFVNVESFDIRCWT